MRGNKLALIFLLLALGCFGFDLFHFSHHLRHDTTLLHLPRVGEKLFWKAGLFSITLGLVIFSRRMVLFIAILGWIFSKGVLPVFASASRETCEQARELMTESGIARDAKEGFLGNLKIQPPRGSFPPEMDKVTWWGTFKPFEFWESPEFQATWINPQGEPVGRSTFRGGACALAKTTLRMNELPQGRLTPGMWRVIVNCRDVTIDNHPFAVMGPSASPGDASGRADSGVMIWADEVNQR